MCLAVPSKVVEVDGLLATVEAFGRQRRVNLMLMQEPVAVGDYLLIQVGDFAFERVDAARAEESLRLMAEILAQGDGGVRAW
jgi:hydrogenase expression/formation protein HypC